MRWILGVVVLSVSGCTGRQCDAIYYWPILTVLVSDETGAPLQDFTFTTTNPAPVAVEGMTLTVTCPQDPACGPNGVTVHLKDDREGDVDRRRRPAERDGRHDAALPRQPLPDGLRGRRDRKPRRHRSLRLRCAFETWLTRARPRSDVLT